MNVSIPRSATETASLPKIATNDLDNRKKQSIATPDRSISARSVQEYYSSTSVSFEYTSKDGDTVSLSMQSVEYSKSLLEVSSDGSKADMEKLVDYIKKNLEKLHKQLIKTLVSGDQGENNEADAVSPTETTIEVPEYWNAENTSQRIVDFSISFFGAFKGTDEEFMSTIRSAIDEGFKQAREMLGDLPEGVSSLVDDTYSLVMSKLDSFAAAQKSGADKTESVAA